MKNLMKFNNMKGFAFALACLFIGQAELKAQGRAPVALPDTEDDFYKMISLPVPEDVILEVGGMATMPDGSLAICTRRGEVWIVSSPEISGSEQPVYKRFAHGLHEPLGLAYHEGDIYVTQRSELTRLTDTDGDGKADVYKKIVSWPLSGNYHEYSYGPVFLPNGNMLVTLNVGWSNSLGHGVSLVPWRGWTLEITPEGEMKPFAAGMRSPAGYGLNAEGDFFYTENQGDWVGSGRISHVEKGDFLGNAESLAWSGLPGSTVTLKKEDIPNTGEPMYDVSKRVPGLKAPAIWLPHGIMGISTSGFLNDNTAGGFGPFANQVFVGDQGQSNIARIDFEKIDGVYQGVAFPFREGFSSGILRMVWGNDASMFVGMTSRGWSSTGKELFSLQRLVWTGRMPFEMKTIKSKPDGFEIEFTQPVNKEVAENPANYQVTGFTYKYQAAYGSPVINNEACNIIGVVVSEDGMKARLVVENLRLGYIHEIKAEGVESTTGKNLLHPVGYYTLNNFGKGELVDVAPFKARHDHEMMMKAMADSVAQAQAEAEAKAQAAAAKKQEAANKPAAPKMGKHVTSMPADWGGKADLTINMGTKPGLKFDPAQVQVKAGSKVKLVFQNVDDMLHNLVIVMPGTALEVGEAAMKLGLEGQQKDYIPNTSKVLVHTKLLQPSESNTIYFIAPTEPGEYTYVCTVPGHFYTMQGVLKVVK
ncbi:plastocyanin/azurin family copper-binding protein [Algoriphagus sp. NG3]|uniref:plastocyanin/azurin family copper-binding protein n=1 Tax=unclassified Algoriphagus TaxID=2641541 RepID=UPI002A829EDF|nr:plastocyanin/azurin family copper-binding protein [Algoriphagus sp. NG3]WPR76783.1 plastocyanin/azurin family copper-binding protein [Algoriphagus sp. NG3]